MTTPNSENLLFLNPTAAWIYQNYHLPDAAASYAEHFCISTCQAEADIAGVLASVKTLESGSEALTVVNQPSDEVVQCITCQIEGTKFLIRFGTDDLAQELLPRLEGLRVDEAGIPTHVFSLYEGTQGASVYCDGAPIASEPLITGARAILLQELTRLAVPGRDFKIILHAGAVGDKEQCLILAGASFSGKSTLCTALMQDGWLCYSDDSAAITNDFLVAGMPFAISLREGSWPLFPHLNRPRFLPSNLERKSPAAKPKAMLFVNYQETAGAPTLSEVGIFEALVALQQSGFWVEHTQAGISDFLSWLGSIPKFQLTYSDLTAGVLIAKTLLS